MATCRPNYSADPAPKMATAVRIVQFAPKPISRNESTGAQWFAALPTAASLKMATAVRVVKSAPDRSRLAAPILKKLSRALSREPRIGPLVHIHSRIWALSVCAVRSRPVALGDRMASATTRKYLIALARWFDTSAGGTAAADGPQKADWFRCIPFVVVHLMCLGIIWVGWSPIAVAVAAALYFIRMFAITGFYHRYF